MSRNAMNQCIEEVNAAEEERRIHHQEWLAELAARRREHQHFCLECRCTGYHAQGCPADEDEETGEDHE